MKLLVWSFITKCYGFGICISQNMCLWTSLLYSILLNCRRLKIDILFLPVSRKLRKWPTWSWCHERVVGTAGVSTLCKSNTFTWLKPWSPETDSGIVFTKQTEETEGEEEGMIRRYRMPLMAQLLCCLKCPDIIFEQIIGEGGEHRILEFAVTLLCVAKFYDKKKTILCVQLHKCKSNKGHKG